MLNVDDNCPSTSNPDQTDTDGDGLGAACDPEFCIAPPSNLVSWWPGDGDANDLQGVNNGTLVNGATFAPGKVGQAFSFDGTDDYVSVPNPSFKTNIQGTIEAWIKFDDLLIPQIPAALSTDGTDEDEFFLFVFRPDINDRIEVIAFVENQLTDTVLRTADNDFLTDSGFHHYALTSDGVTVRFCFDGAEVAIVPRETGFTNPNLGQWFAGAIDADIFAIGALKRAVPVLPFNGLIDEMGVYDRAFSGAPTVILYDFRLTETFLIAITDTTSGETQFRDSTSTITFNGTNATQEYQGISGFLQNMSFARQPHCDRDGNLQWPGEGLHRRNLTSDGILYMEWELKGCISFFSENDQHGRENATCCEHPANSGNYVLCSQ